MRLHAKHLLGTIAVIALAFPVWARTDSTVLHSDGTTIIGQTQLKSGDYNLKVKDNAPQLEVTQDGKVVAQVPVKWVTLQKTPTSTEVIMDKGRVVEVDFSGKTQAVKVASEGTVNSGQGSSGQQ
jgi:hypothetical protein